MKNSYSNLSNPIIIVMGDVILDVYYMGEVKRLSPEAPVPIINIKKKTATLGGAGNVALNLIGLGCHTSLLGVSGDDHAGGRIAALLKENSIGDDLVVDPCHLTTTKTRIIGERQQISRLDEEEKWEGSEALRYSLLRKFEDHLGKADLVILSDYNKGVLNRDTIREAISLCKKRNIPVFVDPKRPEWDSYRGATCITPNILEVEAVTGKRIKKDEAVLADIAISLRERYEIDWLMITRGPDGICLVGTDAVPLFIKAKAREVYDVSGAGDTVIATLAAGVASGLPFPKATEVANIAAGIVVGKLGAQPVSLGELEAALRLNQCGADRVGNGKLTTLNAAKLQTRAWQAGGEKIALVKGSFDLLHLGHIHILQQAKELGCRVVVGLTSDSLTKPFKGLSLPIFPQGDRAGLLAALSCVDLVVTFEEESASRLINELRPDFFVVGTDSSQGEVIGRDIVESYGGSVCKVSILDGYSTAGMLEKILNT
ncbi:MAG: D-glycero-beta-D-manno-heptose-7-phosphate kinase [Pseudomonadota bacterium]